MNLPLSIAGSELSHPSARSGDLLGNGEMLVMRTTEDPTDPIRKLISSKQSVGFDDLALSVYPLRLYDVEPWTLLRKKATYDPHAPAALLDAAVVGTEPASDLPGDVPASVVPDEQQNLLSSLLEYLQAPFKESGRYGTHGPAVHEPYPRFADLRKVESVAGDGFRLRVVFGERPPDEAERLAICAPGVERWQGHPAPPAFVLEADSPLGIRSGDLHQSVAPSFFLSYNGSGEVIHRFARIHLTRRRRDKVARMVSPEPRSVVSPSSTATSATISKVQRLDSRPSSLGERWSICLKDSALFSSKAACTRFGRDEPGVRASPGPSR